MRRRYDSRGMISLVICMLMMIVISLITLAFATLSRREQRQAIDKQLVTQAFYAAETGINDAAKVISDGFSGNVTDCDASSQSNINPTGVTATLNGTASIARTCVFVNQTPTELDTIVGETSSTVFLVAPSGLSWIDIYWENDVLGSPQSFPASIDTAGGAFPNDVGWNGSTRPGVLGIQLIPANFSVSGGLTRTAIATGLITVYGYPDTSSANTTASGTSENGVILDGGCAVANTPRQCHIRVDGLAGVGAYYLKLKAFYDPVHVTIQAKNASGSPLSISGAQVLIDSTGRAGDEVKRIKVYKPVRTPADIPSYILDVGDDLCKRLQTEPSSTTPDNPNSIASCIPSYP